MDCLRRHEVVSHCIPGLNFFWSLKPMHVPIERTRPIEILTQGVWAGTGCLLGDLAYPTNHSLKLYYNYFNYRWKVKLFFDWHNVPESSILRNPLYDRILVNVQLRPDEFGEFDQWKLEKEFECEKVLTNVNSRSSFCSVEALIAEDFATYDDIRVKFCPVDESQSIVFKGLIGIYFVIGNQSANYRNYEQLLNRMSSLRIPEDFRIVIGSRKFKCHSALLKSQSRVFDRMLAEGGLIESANKEVNLSETLTVEGVNAMLEFLYYGEMSKAQRNNFIILELLKTAHMFEINSLEEACAQLFRSAKFTESELNFTFVVELFSYTRVVDSLKDIACIASAIFRINTMNYDKRDLEKLTLKNPDLLIHLLQGS